MSETEWTPKRIRQSKIFARRFRSKETVILAYEFKSALDEIERLQTELRKACKKIGVHDVDEFYRDDEELGK